MEIHIIKTFDGRIYDFQGTYSYVVARPCTNINFITRAEHQQCGAAACIHRVTISIPNTSLNISGRQASNFILTNATHKVTNLGHVLLAQGSAPDPDKTGSQSLTNSSISQRGTVVFRVGQLLSSFHQRFCFSCQATAKIEWEGQRIYLDSEKWPGFNALKQKSTSAPVLALPNWSNCKLFLLDIDVSETGIGAMLSQVQGDRSECVIAYASRLLSKHECNYCVTRKELLAVVTFLQHFRPYLIGLLSPFILIITLWHGYRISNNQRVNLLGDWKATRISVHHPGTAHANVDALSR